MSERIRYACVEHSWAGFKPCPCCLPESSLAAPTGLEGAELIAAERARQISKEGWSSEHDDEHTEGEMIAASIAYAVASHDQVIGETLPDGPPKTWPWESVWWKRDADPIRNLVKAGALIAAEIDRLQRKLK